MNFRNLLNNPRTMMRVAMVFLVLFNIWPRFLHVTFGLGEDWIDGLRGMLLGITLGLLILIVRRKGFRRCCDEGRT